jgi:putative tryptophan/tyrosine transport system substrate-binding protein
VSNIILWLLMGFLFCPLYLVNAQQAKDLPRIAFLNTLSFSSVPARTEAFRQGLLDLGYVEGKNIVIEWRSAEGNVDRVPGLASELVRRNVNVIVTGGPTVTRAAKEATATIPIVMAYDTDPVVNGFVASLAHPGGNVTGLSTQYPEISGKQLELLKEIVPRLSRVAVIGSSTVPGTAEVLRETEVAARAFGVQLHYLDVLSPKDIETTFQAANKSRADAVLVLPIPLFNTRRKEIADLAKKSRLPSVFYSPEWVESGGLMSHGVSFTDLHRRAAVYVDKILKGAKPADLPVEQPTKFELVINLQTAKQIGLTIPPNVLARADKVIR